MICAIITNPHCPIYFIFNFSATKDGTYETKGWPNSAYGTSKIGVTVMSIIHQMVIDNSDREDILINAVSMFC